jgi:regulator of sirC expression with transglutaminase-like and TPR domain
LNGPAADRAEALVLAAEGNRDAAFALLRSAIADFERYEAVWDAAVTQELLADLQPDDAAELVARALATYERLGAAARLDRGRRALRRQSPPPRR